MISAVISYKDKRVSIHESEAEQVGKIFPKGFYKASTDQHGNLHINEQKLAEIHNPYKTRDNSIIMKTVESFFTEGIEQKVNQLGFIHKLGILLHGAPGTGKTALMNFIAKKLIEEKNAIVFFCDNDNTLSAAVGLSKLIREIQNNVIVFIADEFDIYVKGAEAQMKNLLDGKDSVSNTLFLAATNYIDVIPDTLKKRASRFKVVKQIHGITNKKLMKAILTDISNKISPSLFTEEEIDREVATMKEPTLDDIKHHCLDKLTDNYLPKEVRSSVIGFKVKKEGEDEEEEDGVGTFVIPGLGGAISQFFLRGTPSPSEIKPSNI